MIREAFANYQEWWQQQPFKPVNLQNGILPGDFAVSLKKEGARLGGVGLNTAFLQLTEGDYENKLALHVSQFHEMCEPDGFI